MLTGTTSTESIQIVFVSTILHKCAGINKYTASFTLKYFWGNLGYLHQVLHFWGMYMYIHLQISLSFLLSYQSERSTFGRNLVDKWRAADLKGHGQWGRPGPHCNPHNLLQPPEWSMASSKPIPAGQHVYTHKIGCRLPATVSRNASCYL